MAQKQVGDASQLVGVRCNELRNEVYAVVIVGQDVALVLASDFTVLHADKRRIIAGYAAEDAGMCLPVGGIGIALQGGEVDG